MDGTGHRNPPLARPLGVLVRRFGGKDAPTRAGRPTSGDGARPFLPLLCWRLLAEPSPATVPRGTGGS